MTGLANLGVGSTWRPATCSIWAGNGWQLEAAIERLKGENPRFAGMACREGGKTSHGGDSRDCKVGGKWLPCDLVRCVGYQMKHLSNYSLLMKTQESDTGVRT